MWFLFEGVDPYEAAWYMNLAVFIIGLVSFGFVLYFKFADVETLYDLISLPYNDPRKITYHIEPMSNPCDPVQFPSVFQAPALSLSVVIPAYNEEKRLPRMLQDTVDYLRARNMEDSSFSFEVIVVDDGSKDSTAQLTINFAQSHPEVRLLRQPYNMGKGAAVQAGCLHARGRMMLMADADGATKISELRLLQAKYDELYQYNQCVVVVGSRAHVNGLSKADRTFIRNILGKSFHTLIWLTGVRGIKDTQCGFKLFSREAARWLFPNQHIQRWCFDPELLVIARKKNMDIAEIPVEWHEIEGSKMKVTSMINMALDLLTIAICYNLGIWKIEMKKLGFMNNDDREFS